MRNLGSMKAGKIKKVCILVIEDSTPMAPICAMEIFNKAGAIHEEVTGIRGPFFETRLVGIRSRKVRCTDQVSLQCHSLLEEVRTADLVLIPSLEFDVDEKLRRNKAAIPHLLRLRKRGAELGSMCTGSFLLAATGLLKNRSATTHWYAAPTFRTMFPDTTLEDHKIFVDESGLYSSGGATSSMHLGLYLVEKYCGKTTADLLSRMLLLESKVAYQTRFSIFLPQTQHKDEAIHLVQKAIEQDRDGKLTVDRLAGIACLSKRSFIRRFKSATGNTPVEYIQRTNVEKAKRQLEASDRSIEEIIYSLGYNDIHSFRKVFSRWTSLTLKEYRDRYR
jgi:transcriptional regulator GlxA family with amidase domain